MSVTTGLASFPSDGRDADTLLSEADRRMYEAKNRKKAMLSGGAPVESVEPVALNPVSLTTE